MDVYLVTIKDDIHKISGQVPTPTQATLIDYSETIMVVVEMIYFGGQHRPPFLHSTFLHCFHIGFRIGRDIELPGSAPHAP